MSRLEYIKKNVFSGLVLKFFTIFVGFLVRKFIIISLGSEYLGVNGVLLNVLNVLSLAELGIGGSIIYGLYKPLAENDTKKVAAYMNFYRIAYTIIGLVILAIGILLIPFLGIFIDLDSTSTLNIYLLYGIYLFKTVSSYMFFAYRSNIFVADQKSFVINKASIYFQFTTYVFDIIILTFIQNRELAFYTMVFSDAFFIIFQNIYISILSKRKYPQVWNDKEQKLDKQEIIGLAKNSYSLSLYSISWTVLGSTDNLIIGAKCANGLVKVGKYSNFLLISNAFVTLTGTIFSSITSTVGNINALDSNEKKINTFWLVDYLCFAIFTIVGIVVFECSNAFVEIFFGKDYVFPITTVLLITLNFYLTGLMKGVLTFRDACGLFYQGRYRALTSAILNIAISLFLVKYFDINGVLLGTIISNVLTIYWFEPFIVFKYGLKANVLKYYRLFLSRLFFVGVFSFLLHVFLNAIFGDQVSFFILIIKGLIVTIIMTIYVLIIPLNKNEKQYFVHLLKSRVNR